MKIRIYDAQKDSDKTFSRNHTGTVKNTGFNSIFFCFFVIVFLFK